MVMAELRAFRVWVEMKFEQIEQRFAEVDRRLTSLEDRFDKLQRHIGWRVSVLNVTLVAAIIGTGVLT